MFLGGCELKRAEDMGCVDEGLADSMTVEDAAYCQRGGSVGEEHSPVPGNQDG